MTKKELTKYLNKPVMLSYFWNGAKNIISCEVIKIHYRLKYRKLDSKKENYVRYSDIDKVKPLDISDAANIIEFLVNKRNFNQAIDMIQNLKTIFKYNDYK